MTMEEGGFVIDEVEVHDFMRYVGGKQKIPFRPGFTVITGKTGAGKSTILDAVTYALYGSTTRTDPPSNIKAVELFQPGGYARISFRQQGHTYEVKRGFNARNVSFLELNEDGASLGGAIPEKDKMIENIVGLDYEGFRNSTFVRQEEMKELGSEKGSDRLRVFQKLFRLETFEKAQEAAHSAYKELESEAERLRLKIQIRRESIAKMPEMQRELSEVEESLARDRKSSEELKGALEVSRQDLQGKEAGHEQYIRLMANAMEAEKRVAIVSKRLEKERAEAEKSAELRRKVDNLEKEMKDYERLREEEKALSETQSSFRLAQKDVEAAIHRKREAESEHEHRLKSITDRLFSTEKRITELRTDVSKEEAFDLLRAEGGLSERIDRIEKELLWLAGREDLLSLLKEERVEAETKLLDVSGKVSRVNQDSFVLSELKNQVASAKAEIKREDEDFRPRLIQLEAEVQQAIEARDKVKFTEADEKALGEIRGAVSRLRSKALELETARGRLRDVGDVAKLVSELEEQRGAAEAEVLTLTKAVKDNRPNEEAYAEAKRKLEEFRSRAEKAAVELGRMEEAAKRLARQMKDLKEDEGTISDDEKLLKELQAKSEILAILKDEVFHKKGVVMYAIRQLMPALEVETSRNLADMTDGRFSKVKLETYEEPRGHGVRITVEGVDGQWHDIGEFSGGERTQINAALRFAIAQQLASMPQIGGTYGRMKTLFIDEGDLGSLDTEVSRDLFVQKLFRMGGSFEKVILITHLTEVAEMFQSRMHVEMNDRKESRVEVVK